MVGFWLLLLFMVGVLLGFSPNTADYSAIADHQRDAMIIIAADTDPSESDEDDDEWEA
jgi:hypothetical protein